MKNFLTYFFPSLGIFIITFISNDRINDLLLFSTPYYFSLWIPFLVYICFYLTIYILFLKKGSMRIVFAVLSTIVMGIISYKGMIICSPIFFLLLSKKEIFEYTPKEKSRKTSPQTKTQYTFFYIVVSMIGFIGEFILFALYWKSFRITLWGPADYIPLFLCIVLYGGFSLYQLKKAQKTAKKANKQIEKYKKFFYIYLIVLQFQSFLTITVISSLKILFWQWIFIFLYLTLEDKDICRKGVLLYNIIAKNT